MESIRVHIGGGDSFVIFGASEPLVNLDELRRNCLNWAINFCHPAVCGNRNGVTVVESNGGFSTRALITRGETALMTTIDSTESAVIISGCCGDIRAIIRVSGSDYSDVREAINCIRTMYVPLVTGEKLRMIIIGGNPNELMAQIPDKRITITDTMTLESTYDKYVVVSAAK